MDVRVILFYLLYTTGISLYFYEESVGKCMNGSQAAHTITMVVDDGTDQVEESFVIRVKEEEGSPGPGLVAVIAVMVLAGLVMVRRRR